MISKVIADGKAEYKFISDLKERCENNDKDVTEIVSAILANVKANGDKAVNEYTLKFDGSNVENPEITKEQLSQYASMCDKDVYSALEKAAKNISDFHQRQLQQSWLTTKSNGVILGQRVRGLKRVGIYVPGGTAAYPSSVLMNAIPARIAGVEEIIMVTPPGKDGKPNPDIMAAAQVAGVDRVFQMGGAQAVAALAYGTETVPKVDKIVGPGNIFVATAKKLLFGTVDIDMIAGPSEILVIADKTARADYLAADLMSQAEHDILASAILLTDDANLADKVNEELKKQSATLSRKEIIEKSLKDYGVIIVCRNISEAVEFANILAPEHLEVCVENPMEYIGKLDNAGSVFLGNYSPEPLGDYFAGPNHVLPTSGTARFFSPLSVDSFIKKSSFIYYTKEALLEEADDIIRIANAEGLTAHANSIIVRKENETKDWYPVYKLNKKISELTPYSPITGEYKIRLDANESCFNLSQEIIEEIKTAVANIDYNRYPDPNATDLCKAFADYYNIDSNNVTAFNGSDELISILMSSFMMSGETVVTVEPDFSMYRFYASLAEVNCVSVAKNDDLSVNIDNVINAVKENNAKAVIFSNPCNPTSKGISRDDVIKLVTTLEDTLVILDEAYMDFWDASLLALVNDYDNLVIMRTASKAVGAAAIRLGFAVANPTISKALKAVKSPYNVNTVSQKIGTIIYSNKAYLKNRQEVIVNLRENLYNAVKEIESAHSDKIKLINGCSNFLFIKTDLAKEIFDFLLNNGVAIRFMGEYLRITAGTQQENTEVVRLLKEFLN